MEPEKTMKNKKRTSLVAMVVVMAVAFAAPAAGASKGNKPAEFRRINIKSGYLTIRNAPTMKGKAVGVFYAGDNCAPALGETKKDGARTWAKVYNPYLRADGWVDAKYLSPSGSDCSFEKFLLGTKDKADWVFGGMEFPFVISSPNVEEKPDEYTKEEVLASTKNLYDGPYYYLQLLDGRGMKKFWAERDGCAKYELIENRKFDVNSYILYYVKKEAGSVSMAFSCGEMYPELKFRRTETGYVLEGIVDSGS